jgi:hypothetical protein
MQKRIFVGYIAQASQYELLCDGEACVVMGSRLRLKAYLVENAAKLKRDYVIKKAWLADILTGLEYGGEYAFDDEAYKVFRPMAERAGLRVGREERDRQTPEEMEGAIHLVRVKLLA